MQIMTNNKLLSNIPHCRCCGVTPNGANQIVKDILVGHIDTAHLVHLISWMEFDFKVHSATIWVQLCFSSILYDNNKKRWSCSRLIGLLTIHVRFSGIFFLVYFSTNSEETEIFAIKMYMNLKQWNKLCSNGNRVWIKNIFISCWTVVFIPKRRRKNDVNHSQFKRHCSSEVKIYWLELLLSGVLSESTAYSLWLT